MYRGGVRVYTSATRTVEERSFPPPKRFNIHRHKKYGRGEGVTGMRVKLDYFDATENFNKITLDSRKLKAFAKRQNVGFKGASMSKSAY